MVHLVSAYIEHFTYLGLFIVLILCGCGLPLPEDVALLAGGFMVHRGLTRYPLTLLVSFVGVVAGDNTLYYLGRRFGTGLVAHFGLSRPASQKHIEKMTGFMRRHGHRAIFYARFLAGLRALVYLTAGSLGVTPLRFLGYDVLGAVISVPIVVSLGYLFGNQLDVLVRYFGGFERLILIIAALSLVLYAVARILVYSERNDKAI